MSLSLRCKTADREGEDRLKRRKKYDPERREHYIKARVNEEELREFQAQVEKLGITQSDYIRQAVMTAKVNVIVHPVYDSDALDKIAAEYSKIGNNINQIAKHLNEGNPMTARLQKTLNHCIADLSSLKAQIEKMAGDM